MDDEVWVEPGDRVYQRQQEEPAPVEKMGYEGKAAQARAALGEDLWEMHAAAGRIVDFTTGRSLEDYRDSDVLRAALHSMLNVMAGALGRIEQESAEVATRLSCPELTSLAERVAPGENVAPASEVWGFVQNALPELLARTRTELEAWHAA